MDLTTATYSLITHKHTHTHMYTYIHTYIHTYKQDLVLNNHKGWYAIKHQPTDQLIYINNTVFKDKRVLYIVDRVYVPKSG